MASVFKLLFVVCVVVSRAEDLRDFEFERDPDEVMIAQESRHYQTIVKPPVRIVKPTGVTNSHRPQYNLDSLENESLEDFFEPTSMRTVVKNYKSSSKIRAKEVMVKDAVLRAMERKDHVGKFAQLLPIIRAMSGSQRLALASLVANQVTTPPGRAPLNLAQVRSMFGSTPNTTDLMLPILLDMANLIRRAVRPGKEVREIIQPYPPQLLRRYTEANSNVKLPNTRLHIARNTDDEALRSPNRRSYTEEKDSEIDSDTDDASKHPNALLKTPHSEKNTNESPPILRRAYTEDIDDDNMFDIGVLPAPTQSPKEHIRRIIPQTQRNTITTPTDKDTNNTNQVNVRENSNITNEVDNSNLTKPSSSTTEASTPASKSKPDNISRSMTLDNGTLDLMADSTNQTLAQDLPIAEKLRALNRYVDRKATKSKPDISRTMTLDNGTLDLMVDSTNQTLAQDLPIAYNLRALNRYVDRKGNLIRRGTYPPKPYSSPVTRRPADPGLVSRRRPAPARKPPAPAAPASPATPDTKCELFTNTLCLHADDYPTEAIVQSIRRNKAAAGALLADFKDPGEGALDGVTAAQESKYTADHYLVSNRRGDTASRDFASAGEAGFMCPSTVKYARPQRARATSGQWKYIVNTGEHTQTLRLEKCLKPKDSCTYLTDNFKSKCVQVYNYHRLLTWDQQNGLHMDIFKVPTCCSCHIEGYSVSFPPLGHRIHETSSEHFPGEDLSSETGNHAFEAVQSTIQRPTISKSPPFTHSKPESFPPFADNNQNLISVSPFNKGKLSDSNDVSIGNSSPLDSYSNSYFPDSFNQASSIRNVRRPQSARNPTSSNSDSATLPSYLEPPTQSASNSFSFVNEPTSKFKSPTIGSSFKRGAFRPSRRPIRKKISGGPDDLMPAGSSTLEAFTSSNMETVENFDEYLEEPQIGQASVVTSTHHQINHPIPSRIRPTIGPKLQAVVTTEKISTTSTPQEQKIGLNENFTSNGKRINYNYHPIIDFFGENVKESEDESIDREDSESYVAPIDSEWKPINHPPPRSSNLVGRKKHR